MDKSSVGIAHMMQNADVVIWITAIVLLVMSIVSWTLILAKGRIAQRLKRDAAAISSRFWQSASIEEGIAAIRPLEPVAVFSTMAQAALDAQAPATPSSLDAQDSRDDRFTRCLRKALHASTVQLEAGLVALASIGATSPFVGLFGTVWSIYNALANISGSGQIMIEQVAGPVGEALIMTAFGLFVAIPAVLAYNALSKSNRIVLAELDAFANDLRAHLRAKG